MFFFFKLVIENLDVIKIWEEWGGGICNQLQFFPITLMVIRFLITNFRLENNCQGNNYRRELRAGCIIWRFVLQRCLDPRLFNFESLYDWQIMK